METENVQHAYYSATGEMDATAIAICTVALHRSAMVSGLVELTPEEMDADIPGCKECRRRLDVWVSLMHKWLER